MGTIDDRANVVLSAVREYVEAWKALRKGPHASDQHKLLEGRLATTEKDLRAAVDALVKT